MELSLTRNGAVEGSSKDLKFTIAIQSLDIHTHGEMTRADKQAITAALAKAADVIQQVLSQEARAIVLKDYPISYYKEVVPENKAIWQSDNAKTYQCGQCRRPIYSQYEGDEKPASIFCLPNGDHELRWAP